MRVLFFGDSIAQGFWDSEGGWVERLRKHYDSLALKNLRNNKQPEIFNVGVSGDTTRSLLSRIEAETRVRKWPNSLLYVVVAIGTNDDLFESDKLFVPPEEFKANLVQIVKILEPISQAVVFLGNPACDESKTRPVFWGDYTYTNKDLERSEKTIDQVAKSKNVVYIPLFEKFKAKLDEGAELLADGLHPNDEGHKFIFELVRPELDKLINT